MRSSLGVRSALSLLSVSVIHGALPPGYDEELWCPPATCLRPKQTARGWVGPRSSFNECVGMDGQTRDEPRAWGEKIGPQARARLEAEGYTRTVCRQEQQSPSAAALRRWRPRAEGTTLLPQPGDGLQFSGQHRPLGDSLTIKLAGTAKTSGLVRAAAIRFLGRLERIASQSATGTVEVDHATLTLRRSLGGDHASAVDAVKTMEIHCTQSDPATLSLNQDEGYTLRVQSGSSGASITQRLDGVDVRVGGESAVGVMQGLEALAQLIFTASDGGSAARLPVVAGFDSPRFPWRGVLIDVARHFMPLETLHTIIDGAAALRMNVLHLHLTDDQGWRFESTLFPEFHRAGTRNSATSDQTQPQQLQEREYYTPEELQGLVAYARQRGLRIVPEIGFPAHATSLLLARPDLGPPDTPAPTALADTWGVHVTCLDVSNPLVYEVVTALFQELAAIFPDEYVHIGGDETDPQCWGASATIRAWANKQGLSLYQLQSHFNARIFASLKSIGKIAVGWDEILRGMRNEDDAAAVDSVLVQSWTGPDGVSAGTQRGYRMLRSHGYYLDHLEPAAKHFRVDPAEWYTNRARPAALYSPNEVSTGKVLGAEACAWSEYMDRHNVLGRVFPRLAAVADVLWASARTGKQEVSFPAAEYFATAWYLEETGIVKVEAEHDAALRRLLATSAATGTTDEEEQTLLAGLSCVAGLVEPLRIGDRASKRKWDETGWGRRAGSSRHTPLTKLGDLVLTDSWEAHLLITELEPLFRIRSQPDEREAAVARAMNRVTRWRSCIIPCMTASLRAEPGLRDIAALLYQHLDALHQILSCVGMDRAACNDLAATKAMRWVAQAPFVTASREDADVCVAAEIRAANAQLADLYRYGAATHTRDTDGAVQECEMVMDVDLVGGDISPHGVPASSWTQCCELCDATPSNACKAWTYVPTESMCWLKNHPTGSKERLGLVSGVAPRSTWHNDKTQHAEKRLQKGGMLGFLRSLLLGKEEL